MWGRSVQGELQLAALALNFQLLLLLVLLLCAAAGRGSSGAAAGGHAHIDLQRSVVEPWKPDPQVCARAWSAVA